MGTETTTEKAVQAEQPIHRELQILEERVVKCRESMSELQKRLVPVISFQPQPDEASKSPTPESNSPIEERILGIQSQVGELTGWINDAIKRLQI